MNERQTLIIRLGEIKNNKHRWNITTTLNSYPVLDTAHENVHLYCAIVDHLDLLESIMDLPDRRYETYLYYRLKLMSYAFSILPPLTRKELEYIQDYILLGPTEYKDLTEEE